MYNHQVRVVLKIALSAISERCYTLSRISPFFNVTGLWICDCLLIILFSSVVTVIETDTETAVFCKTEPNRNRGFMPLY